MAGLPGVAELAPHGGREGVALVRLGRDLGGDLSAGEVLHALAQLVEVGLRWRLKVLGVLVGVVPELGRGEEPAGGGLGQLVGGPPEQPARPNLLPAQSAGASSGGTATVLENSARVTDSASTPDGTGSVVSLLIPKTDAAQLAQANNAGLVSLSQVPAS